jgi:hypothetical protein
MYKFSNFFQYFLVYLLVLTWCPEHLLSSTDSQQALKCECNPKPVVELKAKSLMKHFQGFSSGFTKLHATLDADSLPDFTILLRQNKTQKRHSYKNSVSSQSGVTWQSDAIDL